MDARRSALRLLVVTLGLGLALVAVVGLPVLADAGLIGHTVTVRQERTGLVLDTRTVTVQEGPDDTVTFSSMAVNVDATRFRIQMSASLFAIGGDPFNGIVVRDIDVPVFGITSVESDIAGFTADRVTFTASGVSVNLAGLSNLFNKHVTVDLALASDETILTLLQQRLDAAVSSRASQATADAIKAKVDGLGTANLDAAVSSRASQATADAIKAKVDGFSTVNLDAPVSSRASQATADAIKAKVDGLGTANLDAAVSSRASQASVDAMAAKVATLADDDGRDLLLRAKIEVMLATKTGRVVLFYTPASLGGQLHVVRAVVADALAMAQQLGVKTTKAAVRLASGDAAQAAGRYVDAYDLFRDAYEELSK